MKTLSALILTGILAVTASTAFAEEENFEAAYNSHDQQEASFLEPVASNGICFRFRQVAWQLCSKGYEEQSVWKDGQRIVTGYCCIQ